MRPRNPTHWTYAPFGPEDDLYQGDVLAPGPLADVLREVHGHFLDPKYLAFAVVSQTCDLVRRGGRCKTRYITLAVVRSLASVLTDRLPEMCPSPIPGVFHAEARGRAEEFLHKILNQNEQAQGMVYLHQDADAGIAEPAVALLRVSISLRAGEHYEMLQRARVGRLATEYRNKLGWLAGNLYSRVDTTDWADQPGGREEEKRLILDLLETGAGGEPTHWIPEAWIRSAGIKLRELRSLPRDQLAGELRKFAPPAPLDAALGVIRTTSGQLCGTFAGEPVLRAFREQAFADPGLAAPFIPPFLTAVAASLGQLPSRGLGPLVAAIEADGLLRNALAGWLVREAEAYQRVEGPKGLDGFVDRLREPVAYPARLGELAAEHLGDDYRKADRAVQAALERPPPEAFLSLVRGLAAAAVLSALTDSLVSRLPNRSAFTALLNPSP